MMNVTIPLDVLPENRTLYEQNYRLATHDVGRLMLFAGDQKVEHLNSDYYGEGIALDNANPLHMFQIAGKAKIGVFAAQLGLIARYGMDFPQVPYLIKLNSKTNLIKTSQSDPFSKHWLGIKEVIEFRKSSRLPIVGIGYTIYLGSEHEADQLHEAARLIYEAHKEGLLSIVWAYPRGKAVSDEKEPHLLAGAAGVVACLGADFVKINYPKKEGIASAEALKEAVQAAGRTQLVCAGGSNVEAEQFLQTLHDQIHISGASGNATGRNIHQRPFDEAVRLANAIYAITVEDKSVEEALQIYRG
ncbi:aldolase [Candidatus Roizmanbacteria bacterium]|nr:aldolase [Candidatus Roizmanbacteria bacterium]